MSSVGIGVQIGMKARRGFGRFTPDPMVLAVLLTIVVFCLASIHLFLNSNSTDLVPGADDRSIGILQSGRFLLQGWSESTGLWKLANFGMQICVMLVLGTAVAQAPMIRSVLLRSISFAGSPRQLVASVAAWSISLALINWSLALIAGALVAREAGQLVQQRRWKLHYPLLCAAGYSGLMVWHGGWSGTAPLKVTQLVDLQEILGVELAAKIGPISLAKTLLGPLNLFVSAGLLILGPCLFAAITPNHGQDPHARGVEDSPEFKPEVPGDQKTDFDRTLENSPWINRFLALLMFLALLEHVTEHGLENFDLNRVNLSLWCLALLAHPRPSSFIAACETGIRGCTGVILQFPLYAGIMAMLSNSGLSSQLAVLVADSGAKLLPIWTFLSAAVLNLLIPSGGGQWAVQGPVIMQAALDTGVSAEHIVMAMAYGDQLTNMLQPFWALPLLALTGVQARDIAGYCAIWMVVGGSWIVAGLLVFV